MATLWPHQQALIDFALATPHAYAFAGVGSGKTLAALMLTNHFTGRKLILAPKPVLPVYAEDNAKFDLGLNIVTLDKGTSARKSERLLDSPRDAVIVVNYETARLLPLEDVGFTLAIADEAHKLGAYNSKQSVALARSLARVPHKLAMSGTPYTDGPHKLFGVMRWLMPDLGTLRKRVPAARLFGTWSHFLDAFAVTFIHNNVRMIQSWKNLDILAERVAPYFFHVDTDDVLDLPNAIDRTHRVRLPAETRIAYDALKHDGVITSDDVDILAPHILTRTIRLQQLVTSGELVGERVALDGTVERTVQTFDIQPRLDRFETLLRDLNGAPVVVFTRYKRDVELLSHIVQRVTGNSPAYLTGDSDTHQAWRNGEGQVLIANIDAGAEGVRLERAAHMLFWSVGYSLSRYEQARARIRRAGQTADKVHYHHIVAQGTIDELIYARLAAKSRIERMITKGIDRDNP